MIKYSIYNYSIIYNEEMIIHNSLTGKIVKLRGIDVAREMVKQPNNFINNSNIDFLFKEGFLVDSNIDEVELANLGYFDKVSENKLQFTILPTEKCNFRCVYCYEQFKKGKMLKETQNTILSWIKKNILNYSSLKINWFGGEPLLAIDVIENLSNCMLDICRKRYIPYSSAITTNGYLLTKEIFKKLLSFRITVFQITLDGCEENHNSMRPLINGGGTYNKILKNLCDIRDNYSTQSFKILIRTNLTKDNLSNIEEHLKMLHKEFKDDNRFLFYFRPTGNWGGDSVNSIKSDLINNFDEIYNPIIKSKYNLCYLPYVDFINNGMCDAMKRNSFVIGSDGTIYKCTMLLEHKDNIIGKVNKEGIVFFNEKISKWVCTNFVNTKCENCPHRPSCNNRTCAAKGYILSEKGMCGYENTSKDSVLKLLSKSSYRNKEIIETLNLEGTV